VKYGSEESIALTEQIYRALALGAHKSSVIMAYERGAFPVHNHELEKNHPFFRRLIENSSEEINDLYYAKGRRNICLTTTAPAGSVSTQTQTTSGIEPTIFIDYLRYRKINPNDTDAKVDRVDELGDKWQQYRVYHHGVVKWMETTGETDTTKSPYFGATCNEIDWVSSVDVQAAAQKWVEHSISKTCNLPRDVSKEVVSQCYMRAWEMGCKGFTVYREGSRDAVIVSSDASKDEQKKEGIVENHAPKRPKELDCDIHQVKVAGESWTMLVGLLNGRPYEVFGGLSRLIEVPKKRKTGRLLKNGRKEGVTTYNLVLGEEDDEMKIKDVVSVFDNETHGAFTRTISLALRHGIPLQYVCEQLQKDKHSDMQSFSRVIARVLKTYIQDGTKSGQSVCDNCGAKGSLVYVDKCVNCLQCGHSKCG
jgi:ribonucleoside-diphosphate reductase alpha chain